MSLRWGHCRPHPPSSSSSCPRGMSTGVGIQPEAGTDQSPRQSLGTGGHSSSRTHVCIVQPPAQWRALADSLDLTEVLGRTPGGLGRDMISGKSLSSPPRSSSAIPLLTSLMLYLYLLSVRYCCLSLPPFCTFPFSFPLQPSLSALHICHTHISNR